MKVRTGAAALAIPVLVVWLAACGSSKTTSRATTNALATSSTSSTTSITISSTSTSAPLTKPVKKKKKHKANTTTTTTSSTTTSTTTSSHTTTTHTTTTHTTTTSAPKLAPLPSPVVSGSSGGMTATLHAENHAPKIGVKWTYMVEAVNSSGAALKGTVATQFVYNGTVVGRESPPTHKLTNGKLTDKVTFPPASKGIQLTFQVVVKTSLGTVTLNWPVKSHT